MNSRSVSPVVGVVLLAGIVILLVSVTGALAVSVSEERLGTATVHSQGQYQLDVQNQARERLAIQVESFDERDPDTEFRLRINGREVHRWNGQDRLEVSCLYPGDDIDVVSDNGETTYLVEEFQVERPTDCTRYTTFRDKFRHGVVYPPSGSGESHIIRDEYDFGLSIEPNGDSVAYDNSNGDNGMNLGQISLQNDWHYIERYDREVAGVEGPVFVIVMVDNVHRTNVPNRGDHESVDDSYSPASDPVDDVQYNWTDDPPEGLNPGEDSFDVESDGTVDPDSVPSTEPTNDVFIAFQPGCDQSKVVFIKNTAGYNNRIYLEDTVIIEDASTAVSGDTFTAPPVDCPPGLTWR